MSGSVKEVIDYCQENNRISPMPDPWVRLWEALPARVNVRGVWQPPLPPILGAWHVSADTKRCCLIEHIELAAKQDALKAIKKYLYGLSEENWFHVGD